MVIIGQATAQDIPSLTTIIPRSYDPDSLLIKLFPPESPLIKEWWSQVYAAAISSPSFHIFVSHAPDSPNTVAGVLTLQFYDPQDPASSPGGLCTLAPLTEDHDQILIEALASQATERNAQAKGQPNFVIDLVAVDREYQGQGIGRELIWRACETADEKGASIFLETTKARKYYLKLAMGFESDEGDEAGVVIRPPQRERSITKD
jgi:ribosomal protein S18 acetylase RimI-like enzyme